MIWPTSYTSIFDRKGEFSKGTLHYMKQNAMGDKPFTLNAHVRERLESWRYF